MTPLGVFEEMGRDGISRGSRPRFFRRARPRAPRARRRARDRERRRSYTRDPRTRHLTSTAGTAPAATRRAHRRESFHGREPSRHERGEGRCERVRDPRADARHVHRSAAEGRGDVRAGKLRPRLDRPSRDRGSPGRAVNDRLRRIGSPTPPLALPPIDSQRPPQQSSSRRSPTPANGTEIDGSVGR